MDSQVTDLQRKGISATYIGKDVRENSGIRAGHFSYVYSNPESLTTGVWRDLLLSSIYKEYLVCIVFDEVHTAVSWGLEKKNEEAFRPEFARVGELRSMVAKCPMLALTATASHSVRVQVTQLLSMKNPLQIVESPDRENIKISVTRTSKELDVSFRWLVDMLNLKTINCEKVIVYCRRIQDCSSLFMYFRDCVKDGRLFDMFHSRTVDKVKSNILSTIQDEKSFLRVIFATNAVGMGLDFFCNCVVHYGPPSEYDTYIQQIGRVGRDGTASKAMLLYHAQQLRKCSPEMLSIVKSVTCRRVALRSLYGDKSVKTVSGCKCCDICERECVCGKCEESVMPCNTTQEDQISSMDMERFVSDEENNRLEINLLALKNDLDRQNFSYSSITGHGLTTAVIKTLVTNSAYVFDIDAILDKFGIFHQEVAAQVLDVFSTVFGDTDKDLEYEEDIAQHLPLSS